MEAEVFNKALACYGITKQQLKSQLSGGTYNVAYEVQGHDADYVIRIGELEFDIETTNGMIEWVRYLSANHAAVPTLVTSLQNNFVEYIRTEDHIYSVDVTHKIAGQNARTRVMTTADLSWAKAFGQAVGKIHCLGIAGAPKRVLQVRPHWDQIGNDFNPPVKLPAEEGLILKRRTEILTTIETLSQESDVFGLVHVDLHLGNILVQAEASAVTILDFDDVAFGWFVMDLVAPITDIVVSHPDQNKDEIINSYLTDAIAGYQLENEFSPANRALLPLFLDLLEIELYTRFHQRKSLQQENGWVKTFMENRKQRIEAGIPFVNIQIEH